MIDIPVNAEPVPTQNQNDQAGVLATKSRDHHVTTEVKTPQIDQAKKVARKIFTLTDDLDSLIQENARFSTIELQQFLVRLTAASTKLSTIIKSLEKTAQFKEEQKSVPRMPDPEDDDGRRSEQIKNDRREKATLASSEREKWPLTFGFWFFTEVVSSIRDFQSNLKLQGFTQEQAIEAFISRTRVNKIKFGRLFKKPTDLEKLPLNSSNTLQS